MTIDVTEGIGDQIINVSTELSQLTNSALYQGNIVLTEVTSGDTKNIPVELRLDKLYLFSDQPAILRSNTANTKAASRAIMVNTNSPEPIAWQASSTVDWLTLTQLPDSNRLDVSIDESVVIT